MKCDVFGYCIALYWSPSWFVYAKSRGYNPWCYRYRASYGGVTFRCGKVTLSFVPLEVVGR